MVVIRGVASCLLISRDDSTCICLRGAGMNWVSKVSLVNPVQLSAMCEILENRYGTIEPKLIRSQNTLRGKSIWLTTGPRKRPLFEFTPGLNRWTSLQIAPL